LGERSDLGFANSIINFRVGLFRELGAIAATIVSPILALPSP